MLGPAGIAAQVQAAPRLAALEARLPPQVDPVFGYAPVCHPGTPSLPSMIRVAPNEDRTGVNFQLALTRLARIEGVAVGMPALNTSMDPIVLVSADGMEDGAVEGARPNLEGRFRFTNVPPGRYRLILRGTAERPSPMFALAAAADVVVADQDISNVVLDLQPGATVEGKVVFSGTSRPPSAIAARVQVRMDPAPARAHVRFVGTLERHVLTPTRPIRVVECLSGSITGSRRFSGRKRDGSWTRRRSPAGMFWTSRWR